MRLFYGIELNDDIRDNIYQIIQDLDINYRGIKWVEKENLHITLEFFGETNKNEMENLIELTKNINFTKFNLSLYSIGGFPFLEKAKVLWVGLKEHKIELMNLYNKLHFTCKNIKSNLDDRPYHPHITIARVKRPLNSSNIKKIEKYSQMNFGELTVKKITLFQSELKKQGPEYKIIQRFYSENVN